MGVTSDRSEALGAHGLRPRNNLLEPAAHVPRLVAGAGLPKDRRVDWAPRSHVDPVRAPLERSRALGGEELRACSLVRLMHGQSGDHPGWAYSERHSEGNAAGSFTIREGPWKYVRFAWYGNPLFNLDDDPGELRDRSGDPSVRPALQDLRAVLDSQADSEAFARAGIAEQERTLADLARALAAAAKRGFG